MSNPMTNGAIRLGVNIDHIATVRQARGTGYPDPLFAAFQAAEAGADGITMHLREDRRHIQDRDVYRVREHVDCRLNLEMAATDEMVAIAEDLRPPDCCLVPDVYAVTYVGVRGSDGALPVYDIVALTLLYIRPLLVAAHSIVLIFDARCRMIVAVRSFVLLVATELYA